MGKGSSPSRKRVRGVSQAVRRSVVVAAAIAAVLRGLGPVGPAPARADDTSAPPILQYFEAIDDRPHRADDIVADAGAEERGKIERIEYERFHRKSHPAVAAGSTRRGKWATNVIPNHSPANDRPKCDSSIRPS